MFKHCYMPQSMINSVIIPIIKNKSGDFTDKNNYGPIALSSIISKVFEHTIVNRLEEYLWTNDNQFGFKSGHSTDLCIYALTEFIEYFKSRSTSVYVAFLDASKVFDKISHWTLFKKLIDRHVPLYLVVILCYWYQHQEMTVRWGHCISNSFNVTNGVRQGGVLSLLEVQRNFKTYKNIIRRSIMIAKRDYYNKLFNKYSKNLKMTWKAINDTLNRHKTKRKFPETFKLSDRKLISDPKEIATAFNDYFISIGELDVVTQPPNCHFTNYLSNKPNCNLQFHPIAQTDVAQIIDNLKPKTSTGIDNISSKLLKRTTDSITAPLTIIINQMMASGIFPDALKVSKVIPLYKKGDESNLSNYRPIALLPSISKIFEKAILTQLTLYLEDNKIIHPHQYGFRKFHSTEYAALHITDYIKYKMDVGKIPINVYLDFSKAFDTLVHSTLLHKMKHYGIDGLAHKLIKSYLENRKQYVEFNNKCSEMKNIKNGVPQGSILGPLLFLIYINDIPNVSNVFNFLMYADDTTLYCCLEDIDHVNKQAVVNQELQKINNWLIANGLKLNTNKSKYMIFSKPNKNIPVLQLRINNANIDEVQNFNFLGLQVSSDITWNLHINEISKKISRIIGILKKLQLIVPKNVLLTIYNTLILPHINYCLLVWGSKSGKILQLQKKAIRAVSCAGYISHTEPLFKFYDILKVNDIYRYKLLNLYYNAKKSNIPIYISTFLPDLSQGARNYEIRNPRLQPPVHFHEYVTETCRYQLAVLLNEINSIVEPLDLLKSVVSNILNVTLLGLKRTVKSYLLQKYSYYCVIPNCYVCQRYLI